MFFSKNFQYFAFSPSPALGCYWLDRKWPANRSDCTLRFQIRWVALLQAGGGLQWIGKKHIFFMNTLYVKISFFSSPSVIKRPLGQGPSFVPFEPAPYWQMYNKFGTFTYIKRLRVIVIILQFIELCACATLTIKIQRRQNFRKHFNTYICCSLV